MKMWNKPYFLVIVDFGLCYGINLCLLILGTVFDIYIPSLDIAIAMMVAYMIGSVYTSKCKQLMPKKLKIQTLIYYNCIIIFLLNFWLLILDGVTDLSAEIEDGDFLSFYLVVQGAVLILLLLMSFAKYWMYGQGSKSYFKKMSK